MLHVEVYGDGVKAIERGELIIYKRWVEKKPIKLGQMVELVSEDYVLGCGIWDRIGVRILSFEPCPSSIDDLIEENLMRAKKLRERVGYWNAYRLVHGDGDLFPGLVVDIYKDIAVLQSSSAAIDVLVDKIAAKVKKVTGVDTVVEKSVQRVRSKAGLRPRERTLIGSKKETVVEVDVEGIKYKVDVRGRKTGLYLDQRENRVLAQRISKNSSFLDLFSYTGGFGLNALHGGAKKVVFVDTDEQALKLLRENLKLNNIPENKVEIVKEDAWKYLRKTMKRRRSFDVVSVDPPALMDDLRNGYELYRSAYAGARAVGRNFLILSSCSRSMSRSLFLKAIYESLDEPYRVMEVRGSAPDHPTRVGIEDYLKTAFIGI
ncbi:SAM-dependent methyltransferase [Ignicoccus pacificus DSM 13166]|uniref:SAM-dependent methyltransferase n=1 Tax=Ignicoccus pacificus DSM 13166 TaxID=940294 RepID=A0A977K9C9_9CREN|nr:SAM-dependent methyltransferase [Ignicoccus pacificus DSM 13166]